MLTSFFLRREVDRRIALPASAPGSIQVHGTIPARFRSHFEAVWAGTQSAHVDFVGIMGSHCQ
jgi:hypothetical protein